MEVYSNMKDHKHFTSLQMQLGTVLYESGNIKQEYVIFEAYETRNPRQKRDERRSWGENTQQISEKYSQNKKTRTRGISPRRRNLLDIWCWNALRGDSHFWQKKEKNGNGQLSTNLGSYWCVNGNDARKLCRVTQGLSIKKEEKKMSPVSSIVYRLGETQNVRPVEQEES